MKLRVPNLAPPFTLLVVLLALALVRLGIAQLMHSSYIFFDELVYLKLAQGLFDHHAPFLRGSYLNFPSLLYPLLLAPLQFVSQPHVSFKLAQALNILLMTSAAWPIYLLTRRLIDARFAVGVAVLAMLAPYAAFANVVMSENLFFPLLMWLAYALMRSLADPGRRWKVLVGLLLGLAFFAKPHGMLLPAVVGLTVVFGAPLKGAWARMLDYWPAVLLYAGFVLLHVLKTNYFLHSPNLLDLSTFFGTYAGGFAGRPLEPLAFLRSVAANLGAIALSIGVLPAVLFVPYAVHALRKGERTDRAFVLFTLLLALVLVGVTARHTVTLDDANRIHERYCFHLAPLLLIGGAKAAQARLFRPVPLAIAGVLTAIACVGYLPQAMASPFFSDTPTFSAFYPSVLARGLYPTVTLYQVVGALFSLAMALLLIRRYWTVAFGLAAAFAMALSGYALQSQQIVSNDYAKRFVFADWVAQASGPERPIGILADRLPILDVWVCESALRQPLSVYYLGAPADTWNDVKVSMGRDGELPELSRLPEGSAIVAHRAKVLKLRVLASQGDAVLYEKRGPVRLALPGELIGVGTDSWSHGRFDYRTPDRADAPARAIFEVMLDTNGLPSRLDPCPVTIEDETGRRTVHQVPLGKVTSLKAVVQRAQERGFRVAVTTPGWSPAQEQGTGDTRTLGVRVMGVDLYADR